MRDHLDSFTLADMVDRARGNLQTMVPPSLETSFERTGSLA
jgi:hypothetical protein